MAENERLLAGRYRVGRLVGRGGMAEVFEGVDTRLGRTVAIKILKAELANDKAFESKFRQEAQASARMAHPTIVRVYDGSAARKTVSIAAKSRFTCAIGNSYSMSAAVRKPFRIADTLLSRQ